MEKKKEIKKTSLVKQPIEIEQKSNGGNNIFVTTSNIPDVKEYHYIIGKDGQPIKGMNKDNDNIIICLSSDSHVNWTQKHAFIKLVKELQLKSYSIVKPLNDAPLQFDLNNLLIKFSINKKY
jgi:hypothetical protein